MQTTLYITFPGFQPRQCFSVGEDDGYPPQELNVEVYEDEEFEQDLSDELYARIHFGIMRDPSGCSRRVVLKMSFPNTKHELVREAKFYANELRPLQGDAVPRFYGLFRGEGLAFPGEDEVACIVLEHCGLSVGDHFHHMPLADRVKILGQLRKVHRAGVLYLHDFEERHVLEQDGSFKVIDFHRAQIHEPPCDSTLPDDLLAGKPIRDVMTSGCNVIWVYCYEFRIWDNGLVSLAEGERTLARRDGWPSQEILDAFTPTCVGSWSDEAVATLFEMLKIMAPEIKRGRLEDLKPTVNARYLELLEKEAPLRTHIFLFREYRE